MPLARYFYFVGGVLLALLFILDATLPTFPVVEEKAKANPPVIRIYSDRKWPERIVYDTSAPTASRARVTTPRKSSCARPKRLLTLLPVQRNGRPSQCCRLPPVHCRYPTQKCEN